MGRAPHAGDLKYFVGSPLQVGLLLFHRFYWKTARSI